MLVDVIFLFIGEIVSAEPPAEEGYFIVNGPLVLTLKTKFASRGFTKVTDLELESLFVNVLVFPPEPNKFCA